MFEPGMSVMTSTFSISIHRRANRQPDVRLSLMVPDHHLDRLAEHLAAEILDSHFDAVTDPMPVAAE